MPEAELIAGGSGSAPPDKFWSCWERVVAPPQAAVNAIAHAIKEALRAERNK
jgi:hypothetical protein